MYSFSCNRLLLSVVGLLLSAHIRLCWLLLIASLLRDGKVGARPSQVLIWELLLRAIEILEVLLRPWRCLWMDRLPYEIHVMTFLNDWHVMCDPWLNRVLRMMQLRNSTCIPTLSPSCIQHVNAWWMTLTPIQQVIDVILMIHLWSSHWIVSQP